MATNVDYKIGVIQKEGGVTSFDVTGKDDMELKVLEIMDEDNYKKIVVQNKVTNEREVHLA